jgi:hypothetical protein
LSLPLAHLTLDFILHIKLRLLRASRQLLLQKPLFTRELALRRSDGGLESATFLA